jgi:ubiquinone/menaquinone biosynthesis C-methylase UbiE
MDMRQLLAYPINAYLNVRSLGFLAEFQALTRVTALVPGTKGRSLKEDPVLLQDVIADARKLFSKDAENIAGGLYPLEVLRPEQPLEHFKRIPRLLWDGIRISRRRRKKSSKDFSKKSQKLLAEMPEYYRRNFHFQSDGYLSEGSAALYEHQVELLFIGAADSMRRLAIPPIKRRLNATTGQGLHILEIGCGTGRTTRFLKLAFPDAKVTALDLSPTYLKVAQKNLSQLDRISFVEADASDLPFKDQSFDAVVSVFLFHELPSSVRRQVAKEMTRVTKDGGWVVTVDSIQKGDVPKFNEILKSFPIDFHEPFYKNYTEEPLKELFETQGLKTFDEDRGFLSKMIAVQRS